MKTVIIANPHAGSCRTINSIEAIKQLASDRFGTCEVKLSRKPGDITKLVRTSCLQRDERIILIGGDGTINECINGLVDKNAKDIFSQIPQILFIPMGTGGDFSRSIGAAGMKPAEILDMSEPHLIDVGKATFKHSQDVSVHYFLNIASMGVSADIADRVNKKPKRLGNNAAFFLSSLAVLLNWKDHAVRLQVDNFFDRELLPSSIVIANGKFFGGGMMIAPNARIDDGLFDIILVENLGALNFLLNAKKLYRGDHLNSDGVSVLRGKRVEITPVKDNDTLLVETDGEIPGVAPVRFDILPKALKILAPWGNSTALSNP